jgi:hypothetical protein
MTGMDRNVMIGDFDPRTICISYAEQNNLTLRTFMRSLTMLSLGFGKKLENLKEATALNMINYNFCWMHNRLRIRPSMTAGVASDKWDVEQLMHEIGVSV